VDRSEDSDDDGDRRPDCPRNEVELYNCKGKGREGAGREGESDVEKARMERGTDVSRAISSCKIGKRRCTYHQTEVGSLR
jgi:hypothetical protein